MLLPCAPVGLLVLALGLGAALPAAAEPTTVVTLVWTKLSFQFSNLGRAAATATSMGLSTTTIQNSASSHLSSISLPGLSLETVVPVTDPNAAPITSAIIDLHLRPDLQGGGVIGNISGPIHGTGPLTPNTIPATGGVTLCLISGVLPPCVPQLNLPFGATASGDRVGMGVGGILTVGGSGTVQLALLGAPWTLTTVSAPARTTNGGVEVLTAYGYAHGPASLTSSTASPSGVLQVVTANHTTTSGPGNQDLGGNISVVLVHVIPEPGLLLLLGAGAAFLALLGWQRGRTE